VSLAALAVVAAFAAAGLSLISAIISVALAARLTDKRKREDWRREHVLPVASDFLAGEEWVSNRLSYAIDFPRSPVVDMDDVAERADRLDKMISRFELISSRAVGHAARELIRGVHWHEHDVCDREDILRQGYIQPGDRPEMGAEPEPQDKLRAAFIAALRRDLGMPD
jgi:hypothetical protein